MEQVKPGCKFGPLAFTGDDIEVGDVIASGTQAQVFACTRVRTGEELAVRVINMRQLRLMVENPEEASRKIEGEVRILREVRHPRCVDLYDIFRTKSLLLLVMEYVRGGDLFDKILAKKHFNELEAKHVFRQIVEGLQFLHSKKIVHRDLKPENILIASSKSAQAPEEGTLHEVKITDFGLAKIDEREAGMTSMVGTPQYWAPEVLARNNYDERVDLWSLGVLLYVMLRGQYPFKGEHASDMIQAGTFDLSKGNWPQVSTEAKDLVKKLLQLRPEDRLSLDGCLRHTWLGGEGEAISQELQPESNDRVLALLSQKSKPFKLQELLQLQLSVATSLELACIACRQSHPNLSAGIRVALQSAYGLSQQALTVIGQYATLAEKVRTRIMPDITLAVQESEPRLALQLLDVVQGWVVQMAADGKEMLRRCAELSQDLHNLVEQTRKASLAASFEAAHATITVPQETSQTRVEVQAEPPNHTGQLLKRLVTFADAAGPDGSGRDEEESRRDLVDLLLMIPGIGDRGEKQPQKSLCADSEDSMVDVLTSPRVVAESGGKPTDALALWSPPRVAEGAWQELPPEAYPLLRALRELRRVGEILQECSAFWTRMGSTVQELSRFKEHTQVLLEYASKSSKLKERFLLRVAEYDEFWGSLMKLCEQYCLQMQPGLQKTHHFISKVEGAADALEAGLRPSLQS